MSTVLPKHFNIATKTERRKVPRVNFDLGSIKSVIFLCFHFKGSRFVRERLQMIFFFLSVINYSICFIYSNLKACRQVVFVSNLFLWNVHALHGSKPRWKQLRMSCYRTISCKKGPLINFFTHVMVRLSYYCGFPALSREVRYNLGHVFQLCLKCFQVQFVIWEEN